LRRTADLAGPALLLSLLIGAGISTFTTVAFSELAPYIPKEGVVISLQMNLSRLLQALLRAGYGFYPSYLLTSSAVIRAVIAKSTLKSGAFGDAVGTAVEGSGSNTSF